MNYSCLLNEYRIKDALHLLVDKVLVITCNEDIQIKRIQKRDNCSKEEALSRISSQISQEDKTYYPGHHR